MKHIKLDFRGIQFKTIVAMLSMATIVISLLWLMQIVFLPSFYENLKGREIKKVCESLVTNYGKPGFDQYVRETATSNEMSLAVFQIDGTTITILNSGNSTMEFMGGGGFNDSILLASTLGQFYENFGEETTISYNTEIRDMTTMTYGQKISTESGDVYFYTNASLNPVDSTVTVLTFQLVIITIICLGICVIASLFLTYSLSNPLTKLTKTAEEMASGNLNVTFDGKGYTEVEQLSKTLNYATAELEKTESLRKDVIANVSHELRTPLTMIKAYAELIRDINGDDKAKREKNLAVILDESDRLKTLINDFLDLSKLQSGVIEYEFAEIDLSALVRKQAEKFKGAFEPEGFEFYLDIEENIISMADEHRIEQVIFNLISNAINYSIEDKYVAIRLRRIGCGSRLEVVDKGVGISEDDLHNIFDRYFRTEQTKRTKIGSGIGLSIVKEILLAHDFKFGAESEPGKGSCFFVDFIDKK
ncbi:MAG: HAMP domain-containing sensor histidine kinase [Clostridia bacterium]|nr:HAMP domain-containing sensor histidine kinase [Clostridia bacterium]